MNFDADYFQLFSLERGFLLDGQKLDHAYQTLQKEVHPDRFSNAGEKERRLSLQWATRANEAYQTLTNPLLRAQYLLELAGVSLNMSNNGLVPTDFLEDQMIWREKVEEARTAKDIETLENFAAQLKERISKEFVTMSSLITDSAHYDRVAMIIRQLMFLDKLQQTIDEAIFSLD